MFSIILLALSFGIINIYAQECKDVKMNMSLTKSGRVELDVDQVCRCAGYSKSPATDVPDLSRWKGKTITDADIVLEKPIKDKSSKIGEVIDKIADIITEETDRVTERRSSIDKETVTETRVTIDKTPITVTTEEPDHKLTEERDEFIIDKKYKDVVTDSADKVTEKIIFDKGKSSTEITEKSVAIKSVKTATDKVTEESMTEKEIALVDKIAVITDSSPFDSVTESSSLESTGHKVSDKKSSDMITGTEPIELYRSLTTEKVTEKTAGRKVTDKSSTKKVIDKSFIALMTTEKIDKVINDTKSTTEKVIDMTTEKSGKIIDKSLTDMKVSNGSSLTTDMTTEKYLVHKNSTHYGLDELLKEIETVKDVEPEKSVMDTDLDDSFTEKVTNKIPLAITTEKVTPTTIKKTDKVSNRSAMYATTESEIVTGKGIADKSLIYHVTEKASTSLPTEKISDIVTYKRVMSKITEGSSTDDIIGTSSITLTTKKIADIRTEKNTIENITEKISTDKMIVKTIENVTEKSTTDKIIEKVTIDKALSKNSIDLTTEEPIDKVTDKNITGKPEDKSIKERITEISYIAFMTGSERVEVTDKHYYKIYTAPTTEKVIIHEKKMENSSEAALGKSHLKKAGNKLQIFLILIAIMVMVGFIFAVCYTVYMSHRSNSYVLPSTDEATPLANILSDR